MKSTKSELCKEKVKSKTACNSKQASKFLEKEGFSGLMLNYKGISTSLSDFIPGETSSEKSELNFEVAKHLKKLEKKDVGTKRKALTELIDYIKNKDTESAVDTLRYWPKIYNRLSLDEDKKVRELSQEMMSTLATICGKHLGAYIKHLLPTWIFAQSDIHKPVANIAILSFKTTFSTEDRRQKAYLLCWEEISEMISTVLMKETEKRKEETKNIIKENKHSTLKTEKEDLSIEDKKQCESIKEKNNNMLSKGKKQSPKKDLEAFEEVKPSTKNDNVINAIVLHMRTLVTLLPYIANDIVATEKLSKWLHSKVFWSHYIGTTSTSIISIYLTFSIDLLTYIPKSVLNVSFVTSNVLHVFRLIDHYHVNILPLVWTAIIKCIDTIGSDVVWHLVSFPNKFLPKWLKMMECGADGHMSLASSFMLPFFTRIPINSSSADCVHVYARLFDSMIKGVNSPRIRNVSDESNCFITTIFECATYTILKAKSGSNNLLKEKILTIMWNILESYMTTNDFNKADKTVSIFCQVAFRPLFTKEIICIPEIIDIFFSWINKYDDNTLFSENFTEMLIEISVIDKDSCKIIMDDVQRKLLEKIPDKYCCVLPYLSVIASNEITHMGQDEHLKCVFVQCTSLMSQHNPSVMTKIAMAMANILNRLPNEAGLLYQEFLGALSVERNFLFFNNIYDTFITHVSNNINRNLAIETLNFWKEMLLKEVRVCLDDSSMEIPTILPIIFHHCHKSPFHHDHLLNVLDIIDESIKDQIKNPSPLYENVEDSMIFIMNYCFEEMHQHFSFEVMPRSFLLQFINLLISPTITSNKDTYMCKLKSYFEQTEDLGIFVQIVDKTLLAEVCESSVVADILKLLISVVPKIHQETLIDHLEQILFTEIASIEEIIRNQERYSLSVLHHHQPRLISCTLKVHTLLYLQGHRDQSLDKLNFSLTHCCILLTPILQSTFQNCFSSSHVLLQCESIYALTQSLSSDQMTDILDLLLISSQITDDSKSHIFDKCPSLSLLALKHFIPTNYSQWPHSVLSSVDLAINSWTDRDLSDRQLCLIFQVLVPCAVKARYLVQEIILASIASFVSEDVSPTLGDINRALLMMKSLVVADPSFFVVCYPLLMTAKPIFESHIDQLYDAPINKTTFNENTFDLSSLLQILTAGVDSALPLDNHQWDFILCLISTLSRSEQFVNSGDFALKTVSGNTDHLFNSYLLLRLISFVSISLASINNESILDEWDNFFSEPIFTTILDMFSLVSGDHSQGRMVSSDLFTFYIEALSEVVSLCPVAVLLTHTFQTQIHINDPIEWPKDFLLVFNSLLESLSSYSLSTQLAAYNCLLNLTDNLSNIIGDQISKVDDNDSLESFSLTLPHKLVSYLEVHGLLNISIDKVENEIILTRCFLAWNIVLQLFSCSQPKVRAELSSFLINHNLCFDEFLSFCFAFMPKNPLINKKNMTFLSTSGKQSCNLISEEPQIFSNCVEQRCKFLILHLSSYLFRRCLQVLPNLSRCWFMSLEVNSQQLVDLYVRQYITPELLKIEFGQLKRSVVNDFDEKIDIQTLPVIGEVIVRYNVSEEQNLEQVISLPNNYPIGKIEIDFKKEMSMKIPHWKSWIIQMTTTMENQNGSILDGVKLWKKNLDNHFEGVEDCMICYSILHALKYSLPSMKCRQCKKKFHKECMFKWFQSSTNATCPNCRHVFFDGTYRRAQYGDDEP